jgi:hypothetical protein
MLDFSVIGSFSCYVCLQEWMLETRDKGTARVDCALVYSGGYCNFPGLYWSEIGRFLLVEAEVSEIEFGVLFSCGRIICYLVWSVFVVMVWLRGSSS